MWEGDVVEIKCMYKIFRVIYWIIITLVTIFCIVAVWGFILSNI